MRCPFRFCEFFIAAAAIGYSSDEGCLANHSQVSPGMVLLQRQSVSYDHVELDTGNKTAQSRPSTPSMSASLLDVSDAMMTFMEQKGYRAMHRTMDKQWARWIPRQPFRPPMGIHSFLSSVVIFDWCLFACAILLFFILHMLVLGPVSTNGYHLTVLMIWLMVGCLYNTVIWLRFGADVGINWFVGYLLELIFLVENVFIFQILIQAFKTPAKLATKALHFVVWGQIAFEMVFFMGLAAWLRSFKALPYLLGVWLIFFGYVAARGGPAYEGDIMETRVCRTFTWVLGERLSPVYEKDGKCLLIDADGRLRVSLLGLVISMLLLVDFLLEIDVVLVKIEELPNPYIAFTSSAVAAFSIPELFFVSKGLLKQFVMLKYGIAAVLTLFGAQLLLSSIYVVRPVVACFIIVFVLATCVLASALISCCGVDSARSEFAGIASFDSLSSVESPHRGSLPRQQKRPREHPKDCTQVPTCDDADTAAGLNRTIIRSAEAAATESK